MATKPKAILSTHDGREASPITKASNVLFENGQTAQDILNDRQDAMISPVIENSSSMFKVGQGDDVDYSVNVVNGAYESMVLKGKSMVNCIQEPSSKDVVLPYEFEEGRYVTINDTKESGALGVELKGQTLVNLYKITESTPYTYGNGSSPMSKLSINLLANKTYLILLDFSTVDKDGKEVINFFPMSTFTDGTQKQERNFNIKQSGKFTYKYTPTKDVKEYGIIIGQNNFATNNPTVVLETAMIMEYQEGMENWDIPYFEGMASCKMPILMTTGKNLLNDSTSVSGWVMPDGRTEIRGALGSHADYLSDFIYVGNINQIKVNEGSIACYISTFDENKNFISQIATSNIANVENCSYIRVAISCPSEHALSLIGKLQVEEGSTSTSYEPYKSSILSLPEEVVLRSLPNGVKDTLNLNTGEYVQRIGEIVLDGSEGIVWGVASDDGKLATTICFTTYGYIKDAIMNSAICSHFQQEYSREDIEHFYNENLNSHQALVFFINRDKLTTPDYNGFNQWLSQNPLTIQYELKTPVIKTVDLNVVDQNGSVIPTLKSWNTTTHIYSEIPENTLYPTLSHSNPSYPVILKPSTKYSIVANSYSNSHTNSAINFNLGGATTSTTVGNRVTTITTPSTLTSEELVMSGRGNKLNNVMVIEGDIVGDEPYFEGICDCKSPILSNVGKNLFDGELVQLSNKQFVRSVNYMHINSNETYAISFVSNTGVATFPTFIYYNEKKEEIGAYEGKTTKNMPQDTKFIKFQLYSNVSNFTTDLVVNVQIEQGSSATSYEPYKSNILSANGDKIELTEDMFEQGTTAPYVGNPGKTYQWLKENSTPSFDVRRLRLKELIKIQPNTKLILQNTDDFMYAIAGYDANKLSLGTFDTSWIQNTTITIPQDAHYISFSIRKKDDTGITINDFKNTNFTLSEVDKTIVLRSLPNGVCDTLNVETGEYVQRIGEIVFDGNANENWTLNTIYDINDTYAKFILRNVPNDMLLKNSLSHWIANRFKNQLRVSGVPNEEGISSEGIMEAPLMITIKRDKLTESTPEGFKRWLVQNPVTVQYELVTPIASTVDIQGFPYAYENGHVQLSSGSIEQSLTPKVEYSVATNRNGQIRSNQKMVERHQKQLDQLQAIILANLVNSQYNQTLTTLKYELSRV